jgi:hypothetical protein
VAFSPGAAGGGAQADPEALLQAISELLDQYLAMGPDTPVAQEAAALKDAIDSSAGADAGAPQPPDGGMGMPPDLGAPTDQGPPPPEATDTGETEPVKGRDSFDRATKSASRDLKKKKTAKA